MAVLAVVYIAVGEYNDGRFGSGPTPFSIGLEVGITVVFIAEYLARLYAADDRWKFVRTHVLDLLALISTLRLLRALRFLRILRLLSIARLATFSNALTRLLRAIGRFENKISEPQIAYGILGIAAFIVCGALALFEFEKGVNPQIQTFNDAFWLAVSIVLTVGISTAKPVTDEGRIVAGVLIIGGLTCISFVSSSLALRFQRIDQSDITSRLDRIEGLIRARSEAEPDNKLVH
jgi:voltage-gated potassium channel